MKGVAPDDSKPLAEEPAKGHKRWHEAIASEALRPIPPRENDGNLDIKQLSKGARLPPSVSRAPASRSTMRIWRKATVRLAAPRSRWRAQSSCALPCTRQGERRGIRFLRFARERVDVPNLFARAVLPLDIFGH